MKHTDNILKRHSFPFDDNVNPGEGLTLTTLFIHNGDPITPNKGVYINQELTLSSHGNDATLNLCGIVLTPEILRQLANELESARNTITQKDALKLEWGGADGFINSSLI
jgi:hypothetical protein